jgi:hypothetical protein
MKNSTAVVRSSQEEKENDGKSSAVPKRKTYRIPISNGIFEHYERLKDARWLLDLYVDWTTTEVPAPDGSLDGIVLYGKPICDEDVASAFHGQISVRTARRWRQRLAKKVYISQDRVQSGYVIRIKKSKKWARPDRPKMADQDREVQDVADLSSERSTSCGRSEVQVVADLSDRILIDKAVDSTKDVEAEEAATAAPASSLPGQNLARNCCWLGRDRYWGDSVSQLFGFGLETLDL